MRKPFVLILLLAAAAAFGVSALSVRQTHVCQSLSTPQAEYDAFKAAYRSDRGRGAFALGPGRYTGNLTMDTDGIDLVELIPGTANFAGTITVADGCDGRILLYDRVVDDWPDVAAADPNYYLAGETFEDGEPNLLTDVSLYPRNLTIRIDPNDTVDNFTITVTGLTSQAAGDTETFEYADWGGETMVGSKAWIRIGTITVADANGLEGSEKLYIGTGNTVGLSWPIAAAGDLLRVFAGADDVTDNVTVDATCDTLALDPNAPNGTLDYRIYYQTTRRGK